MRWIYRFAPLLVACSADTNGPTTSGDSGALEGGADTRPATDTGGGGSCGSGQKCNATDKCWPASCTGSACGGTTISVPPESRCINGCCETLEQSCDRVCPG